MEKVTYEIPTLYGDHHVTEIRKLLLAIPGVEEVYASSAFQMVEVTYDPEKVNDLEIAFKIDQAGYLGEWTIPSELGIALGQKDHKESFSRHTAVFETTKQVVSFSQKVESSGKPLWNCPGFGVLSTEKLLQIMEE